MSDTPKADKAADSGLRLTTCCPFEMTGHGFPRAIPSWVPHKLVSMLTQCGAIRGCPSVKDVLEWCERCGAEWIDMDRRDGKCTRRDQEVAICGGGMVTFNLRKPHLGADWENLKAATEFLRDNVNIQP